MRVLERESLSSAADNPLQIRGHVPALDGVRGFAIVMVLLFHITPPGPASTKLGSLTKLLASVSPVGVDLFFVLSGFLITGILLDAKGSRGYFRTFYIRRALRIFPLYYAVLLVTLVVLPMFWPLRSDEGQRLLHDQGWLWLYASNLKAAVAVDWTFSAGWLQFDHFWSLAVEEQFYLVWPVLVLILPRRAMIGVCVLFIVGALGLRGWLYLRDDQTLAFYVFTPCRFDELAVGGLLALVAREPIGVGRLRNVAMVVMGGSGMTLALTWNTDARIFVMGTTLLGLFFGGLLIGVVVSGPGNWVRRAFEFRLMRGLGKYSYGMYVLHPFILAVLRGYLPYKRLGALAHSNAVGVLLFTVLAFVAVLGSGWISWHLYERHFLKLKRFARYGEAKRTPRTAAVISDASVMIGPLGQSEGS
jgi:peptidoglycan/LPS O-acetylase OafA/YrhL